MSSPWRLDDKALFRAVVLYDPNALNPYGAEVASVLTNSGFRVTRWCRVEDPFDNVALKSRRLLWASRQQVGPVKAILSRHGGSILFALANLFARRPLVFLWLGGSRDLYIALLMVKLGRRVCYVDHNPVAEREMPGRAGKLMRRLRMTSARRVVHSVHLEETSEGYPPYVAGHPSFKRWVTLYGAYETTKKPSGTEPLSALFLGILRSDKGVEDLPEIAANLFSLGDELLIAGRGKVDRSKWSTILNNPLLKLVGISRSLSDLEVSSVLRRSSVLIAPYADVTISGSILMALSSGLPIAAYSSQALINVLPIEFLVPTGDTVQLALRAHALATERPQWQETIKTLLENLDKECAAGWVAVLDGKFPRSVARER